MSQSISVSEFKAKCLKHLSQVAATGRSLVITKRGKPIARVEAVGDGDSAANPLTGSIVFETDLIGPVDEHWNADE